MTKIISELEILSSDKRHLHVLQMARGDPGAVHRAAQRHRVYAEAAVLQKGLPHDNQHLMHDVRDHWRSQSFNALQYQQEQVANAAYEHQRVAYEQVDIAAAPATNHTGHVTSRFRDIENNVEANFSHQQRRTRTKTKNKNTRTQEHTHKRWMRHICAGILRVHGCGVLQHSSVKNARFQRQVSSPASSQ